MLSTECSRFDTDVRDAIQQMENTCPEGEGACLGSKFESDLPRSQDSNFDVMQADRWVRRSQYGREGDCDQETVRP